MVKVGIIGGSGLYDSGLLEDSRQIKENTPFGRTSDLVTVGKFKGIDLVFIPRHGKGHSFNPTEVPYRANIWAMKELKVTHILAPSAVGSLKEEYRPGELAFTDQFIDRTTKREQTFYGGSQVCHISIAEPGCKYLRNLLSLEAREKNISHKSSGTCVVIEGPRFSTRAESNVYRTWNADIIGMTMVPEVILAREAQICYQTIAMVTDYDVWKTDHTVTLDEVIKVMGENVSKAKTLISGVIPKIADVDCSCKTALDSALI